jgi:Domain of unknown function (DUF4388)
MKLEGEIGELDLIERLVELGRERFTGAVRFENDGIIKIIYFKAGDVLSASTNDRTDSVDEILLRAGKVSRDHVKQALAKRKESETLGDALLGLGFITKKELTWARRVQVIGVIRSIAAWPAGSFQIVPDYLPKREEGTQFALQPILLEVVVTDQDRQKFDRAMDGGRAVFAKSDDFDFAWARLGLNEDADAIAMWIDGTHSAAEIASLSGKDAFNVYKLLHALALLGIVKSAPAEDLAIAGVADASDAWATPEPKPEPVPVPIAAPPRSAFDDEPEPEPQPLEPTPAPPPIAPPRYEPEPNWGFDEAQIETARAATEQKSAEETVAKASKPNRWIVLLLAAVVMIGVVFGGFAAWNWWQARNAPPAAPKMTATALPVVRAKRTPVAPPVTTTTVTTTTTTTAPAAMVVKPLVVTPPPTPKPSTTTAMTITPSTTQVTRNAEGTATITNTAASGGGDAQRAHYDQMAKAFASQPATGAYTVQFELVCESASLTKAIRDGGSSVWFTPISYRNRACYRVFWGHYPTKDEATRALREIPLALRGAAPVVVKVPTS